MNIKWLFSLIVFLAPFLVKAQSPTANKDAVVDVIVTDFKNNAQNHEIIIFKSKVNAKEYQGLTDSTGKFTLRLPVGDTYEVLIWGFNDSTSYSFLDIPTPKGNAYYKDAFKVEIQYLPAKSFVLEDCNFETGKAILQPSSYAVLDELVAFLIRKDDERNEDPKKKFNEEQLEKEIDKEKKILIKLLDCIVYLDKNISFINSRRTQYQKG